MSGSSGSAFPLPLKNTVSDIDRAVIGQLLLDGRATVSHLAERIGTTPTTAKLHLETLLAGGGVTVVELVDPSLLNRPMLAYLTVHTLAAADVVASRLADTDDTEWIATTTDLSTVICQISCRDSAALVAFVDDKVRPLDGVRSVTIHSILRWFPTPYSSLGTPPEGRSAVTWTSNSAPDRLPRIDATDRLILDSLQDNGRASLTSLAAACGLSVPATRQRFLHLQDRSIVQIHCCISPELFGFEVGATLRVVCLSNSTDTARSLARLPEVTWVTQLSGEYDLAVEVRCRDTAHFSDVYRQVVTMPEVGETELHRYASVVKSLFRWSH